MLNSTLSVERINQVRLSADGENSAYLLRTRLHRLILSLQRSIASDFGLELVTPIQIEFPGILEPARAEIVALCNSLLLESTHLSQPSEALDERWEISWATLEGQLEAIENALSQLA